MRRRIGKIARSISLKLLGSSLAIFIGCLSLYAFVSHQLHVGVTERLVRQSAERSGDLLKNALYNAMLTNNRANLYATISQVGREPGIDRVRLYDKGGEVKFSSRDAEIGVAVDMRAEACYACHNVDQPFTTLPQKEKFRIFENPDLGRIIGLIIPIYNDPACSNAACHAHDNDKTILGVLDMQFELATLDAQTGVAEQRAFGFATLFLVVGVVLLAGVVYLTVYRPVGVLKEGTTALSGGDLDHRIPLQRHDELGDLARSFNRMADNLREARRQQEAWSKTLEKQVAEKARELEAIHQEMLQVERMTSLGKLAATVAHELNNPLAGILNYAKLLSRRVGRIELAEEDRRKCLDQLALIGDESRRCGNIVKNLLVFARGSTVNIRRSSLEEVVRRAMHLVNHHIELAQIEATWSVAVDPPEIDIDPDQILQALVALLVNAVEAMDRGGHLEISAMNDPRRPRWVRITVADDGPGIPEEIRDHIFEPFYTTKKDGKGSGLGLAVVYGIVQHHKGEIEIESDPGQGTRFILNIPMIHERIDPDESIDS